MLLDFFTSNPVVIVLLIDVIFGVMVAKRALHPIIGNFDIALILQPLGDDSALPPPKKELTQYEQTKYIESWIKGKILTMSYRKEFSPMKQAFRIGSKKAGFTYKVNPKKVAFLQRTHRVYEYLQGFAYPISVSYGPPERITTSKGMDMFIAERLWGQAVEAASHKIKANVPILICALCIMLGAFGGFVAFYALHAQLGFVPYVAPITNSTTHVTATLGK